MIPMSLVGVRVEVPTNQPIVLLREDEGQRYLPIFIGPPEATAIVYALQGMETPRPMTHDLFKTVLDDSGPSSTRSRSPSSTTAPSTPRSRSRGARATLPDLVPPLRRHRAGGPLPGPVPIFAEEAVLEEAGVLFEQDEDEQLIEEFREFLDQVRPEDFAHGTE